MWLLCLASSIKHNTAFKKAKLKPQATIKFSYYPVLTLVHAAFACTDPVRQQPQFYLSV